MSFVRAHSPEQREVRRTAILDTARAMLDEMPVADVTLNGLSRRACMAKSNVLRYFESREAVLLELCADGLIEWIEHLEQTLGDVASAEAAAIRAARIAAVFTASLAERPVLCDLMSAQATVLERNISAETGLSYKRTSIAAVDRLIALVAHNLPELAPDDATRFTSMAALMATSVWTHSHVPAAVLAAYEVDPSLQRFRVDFESTLRESLEIMLAGLLSR